VAGSQSLIPPLQIHWSFCPSFDGRAVVNWLQAFNQWLTFAHRKRMRTTNLLERQDHELKWRTRVARVFPNERSCLRVVWALLSGNQWERMGATVPAQGRGRTSGRCGSDLRRHAKKMVTDRNL
jgi:Transposase, Mutator family